MFEGKAYYFVFNYNLSWHGPKLDHDFHRHNVCGVGAQWFGVRGICSFWYTIIDSMVVRIFVNIYL
jgi:hypothetical protein